VVVAVACGASRVAWAGDPLHVEPLSLGTPLAPAGDRTFGVEEAAVRGDRRLAVRTVVQVALAPLVLRNAEQDWEVVVARQAWIHAQASLAWRHRFAFGLDAPVVFAAPGTEPRTGAVVARPNHHVSLGDVRLDARARLHQTADERATTRGAVAVAAHVWLPTATDSYSGDGTTTASVAVTTDGAHGPFEWAGEAGVRFRPARVFPGIVPTRMGTMLRFGGEGRVHPLNRRDLAVGAELVFGVPVAAGAMPFDPQALVGHAWLTGHYRLRGGPFEFGAAFGPGLGRGAGASEMHALATVGYASETPPPPPDADEDGVPDRDDACVTTPGLRSRLALLNGCPEMRDLDQDAIPDDHDACPTEPGSPTFELGTHGCPESDSTVELIDERIAISEQLQFETGTAVLKGESLRVLAKVSEVLRDHPELEFVEVQGHTDDTGTPELNQSLSERRAESVVAWLVSSGVASERLGAKGFGQSLPIVENGDATGQAQNRRVEFRVVRRRGGSP
jgi:OOP family OmpA-OmpF porin